MDKHCGGYVGVDSQVYKKHMWRGVAHLPANEYQFWCERCGKYWAIKKRIFWGLTPVQYLYAVVLRGKYQR